MTVRRAEAHPPAVEVRRSPRRRATVSAYRDGDRVVVLLPARLTAAEEEHWITVMLERLAARDRPWGEADLMARAQSLSRRYLSGRPRPASVRFVDNQERRWGSCTIGTRRIRLSRRLQELPGYVLDYVLVHELAHLLEPGHGPRFWSWVDRYPFAARARGFLDGIAYAGGPDVPPPMPSPPGGSLSKEPARPAR